MIRLLMGIMFLMTGVVILGIPVLNSYYGHTWTTILESVVCFVLGYFILKSIGGSK